VTGWEGPFPPRTRPRRVEGGLRARSTRGAIGRSWWSKRFLAVLESFALGGRLTRGRAYARAGQVLALRVAPGTVSATVQGSRAQPYRVTVGLTPFPPPVWETVEVALAEQAIYSARLLAGDMPPDIEEVFAAAGAPLFPGRFADLTPACSCPDPVVPCKHLAATFYLLAEAFDDDPFQLLHWRGRDRQTLLARLRELRDPAAAPDPARPAGRRRRAAGRVAGRTAAGPAPAGPEAGDPAGTAPRTPVGPPIGAALALAEVTGPSLAGALDRFWLPPVPLPGRPPTLDTAADLLLRQLPTPGPALGGAGLVDRQRPADQRVAAPTEAT
jgi:uncharacterized Zn finger protein